MKISEKITGGFLAICALFSTMGFLSLSLTETVKNNIEKVVESEVKEAQFQIQLKDHFQQLQLDLLQILVEQEEGQTTLNKSQEINKQLSLLDQDIDASLNNHQKNLENLKAVRHINKIESSQIEDQIEEIEDLRQLKAKIVKYEASILNYLALLEQNQLTLARSKFLRELSPLLAAEITRIEAEDNDASLVELNENVKLVLKELNSNQKIIYAAIFISLIVSILLAKQLSEGIVRPLNHLKDAALELSQGNLDLQINIDSETRGEIGQLARCFKLIGAGLKESTVSKSYLDRILAAMSESLIVTDLEGKIQKANPATCQLLGYSQTQLQQRNIQRILVKSDWWSGLITQKQLKENYPTKYISQAGRLIPVIFSTSLIYDRFNSPCGLVCLAREIKQTIVPDNLNLNHYHQTQSLLQTVKNKLNSSRQ